MRTTEDWSRLGGVLIAALAVATAGAVLGPRLLGRAAGPEVELITQLKNTEQDVLSLSLAGSPTPLRSREHRFARITVQVEPGGQRAEALATLDFTGLLGATEVSSLGVEVVPFVLRDGDWEPAGQWAPRLAAVVRALEARRRALEAGDTAALSLLAAPAQADGGGAVEVGGPELEALLALKQRRYTVSHWRLRLERDEAIVTEVWRLEGTLPSRPVDQRGERRLILLRSGEEFLFSPALM